MDPNPPTPLRINRLLASHGLCSRRQADLLVEEGRVTVNGSVVGKGASVLETDDVRVDGRPLVARPRAVYIKCHKPKGISTTADALDPNNILSWLGYPEYLYPVGRLDQFSSGLILLTNDGRIGDRLLRPRFGHEREYVVRLKEPCAEGALEILSKGIELEGRLTKPAKVMRLGNRAFKIVLTEGRNRQIRRMCEVAGLSVASLRRERIMHIDLGDLEPGEWRELSEAERLELLRRLSLPALEEEQPARAATPDRGRRLPSSTRRGDS